MRNILITASLAAAMAAFGISWNSPPTPVIHYAETTSSSPPDSALHQNGTTALEKAISAVPSTIATLPTSSGAVITPVINSLPAVGTSPPPGMNVNPAIEKELGSGLSQMDSAARKLPAYAVKTAKNVEDHGLAGLMYEDPELIKEGHAIGAEMGAGIRNISEATAKDMVKNGRH